MIGPSSNDLIYFLAWKDLAEREVKWAQFVSDPERKVVLQASEAEGPLLANIASQFLTPTAFSRNRDVRV